MRNINSVYEIKTNTVNASQLTDMWTSNVTIDLFKKTDGGNADVLFSVNNRGCGTFGLKI